MVIENESTFLRVRNIKKVSAHPDESVSFVIDRLLKSRPDKPCHKIRDSLFTSSNEVVDYRRILNFCLILLVSANVHIVLESIIKYGILFDPFQFLSTFFYKPTESPSSLILLSLSVFALASLGIEVLLYKGLLSEYVGLVIITTLLTTELLIPAILLYLADCRVLAAFIVMMFVVTVFLKLASYHITNFWCREAHTSRQNVLQVSVASSKNKFEDTGNGSVETILVTYPDNLNLTDLCYFLFAPTLCYELNFPRIACIRRKFLVKRVLEMLFLLLLNLFLVQQCIVPIISGSLKPLQEMDYSRILESMFKFAVPYMCVWLMSTYCFFHSYLNALGEILRFGDRHFYCDFWNSDTLEGFWQNWNISVHKWCLRHLYLPLRHWGFTDSQSSTTIFFISAVFHEYIFIVTFKMFRCWAFLLMFLQVPMYKLVSRYVQDTYINILGFFYFNIALTLCNIMYYHDYYMINYQNVVEAGV